MSEVAGPSADATSAKTRARRQVDFLTVWGGQTISVFGAQITAFALSIWFFHETGSVLQFGAVVAAQLLPGVLIAPFAGVLVDRYQANRVMLVCEIGLLLTSSLLYALTRVDQLTPTTVLIFTPLIAIFASAHQIAYAACIPMLVPKGMYGKANGYVHLGINGSAAIVPFIAVYALEMLGIAAILLINVITYAVAALTVWVARFVDIRSFAAEQRIRMTVGGLLQQQLFGMRYLLRHRTLLVLITFLATINFANGIVLVLFRPLILIAASDLVLGWLVTIAGIGGLVGAVFSATFIAAMDKLRALASATLAAGLAMLCVGFIANYVALGILVFVFSFSVPVILVTTQTLIQLNTPVEIHGRIFAARTVLGGAAMILAAVIAPLATAMIFEPLLDGWLGASPAQWVGAGEYGAMRAVFLCGGVIMLVLVGAASFSKSFAVLRRSVDAPTAPGLQAGNITS